MTESSHAVVASYRSSEGRSDHIDRTAGDPGIAHVLVVDDHDPTAQFMATVLEDVGDSVAGHVVRDGRASLTALRGEGETPPPDLVLLDLDLPVVDGFTILETKREDPSIRDIPVVVVSGTNDQDDIEDCYRKGANAFIAKPDALDEYRVIGENVVHF